MLAAIDKLEATALEHFDLTNPIDAYIIKPYVGLLPQDFSNVWMNMNCFDNVYFSLLLRSRSKGIKIPKAEAKVKVVEVLKDMGLEGDDVLARKAFRLSGGMLRRLALANTIVGDPKILLLDEISAGVDPVVKRKIWECIQELKRQRNISVVLSTHDTGEIAEMAQNISIMDRGFTLVKN